MKKTVTFRLYPIIIFILLGLLFSGFIIPGCGSGPSEEVEEEEIEQVFSFSEYPNIHQLIGTPTDEDLLDAGLVFKYTREALEDQEYLVYEDWNGEAVLKNVRKFYKYLFGKEDGSSAGIVKEGIRDALEMASDNEVGTVINQLINRIGVDVLNDNIFPMLKHFYDMDEGIWEKDISVRRISKTEFNTLMDVVNRMNDENDSVYGQIREQIPSVWELIDRVKTYGEFYTAEEFKDFIDDILVDDAVDDDIADDEIDDDEKWLMDALVDAIEELWDNGEMVLRYELNEDGMLKLDPVTGKPILLENPVRYTFKGEFKRFLSSTGLLSNNEIEPVNNYNAWDNQAMTDFSRVLYGIEELFDKDTLPRDTFRDLFERFLAASAELDGFNSLGMVLRAVAKADPRYIMGVDHVLDIVLKENQEGEVRDAAMYSQASALRSILFLVDAADWAPKDTLPFLSNSFLSGFGSQIGSMDWGTGPFFIDGTNSRDSFLLWLVGEAATGLNSYSDPLEALQFVMREKDYRVGGENVYLLQGVGLFGLLESGLMQLFLNEIEGPLSLMGWNASIPSLYYLFGNTPDGNGGYLDPVGTKHQFPMFLGPMIQHIWNWKAYGQEWDVRLFNLLYVLNELEHSSKISNDDGAGVVKTIEGPYGYGALTYLIRDHSNSGDVVDNGILDPVLTMISMIVNEMIDTEYTSDGCKESCILYCDYYGRICTLFGALMDYIENNKVFDIDIDENYKDWAPDLFEPEDNGKIAADTTYRLITENHGSITYAGVEFGDMLATITNDPKIYDTITNDLRTIVPIVLKLIGFSMDSADTDTALNDYLLNFKESTGAENPFLYNLKILVYKIFDLYDETHNPQGTVKGNWESARMFTHLFGDEEFKGGIYSLGNIRDFVDELDDADIELFDQGLDNIMWFLVGGSGEYPSGLKFPESEDWPELSAYRALCSQVDVDGNSIMDKSLFYLVLGALHLETDMNGLFEDMVYLFETPDLYPGGTYYDTFMEVIDIVEEDL